MPLRWLRFLEMVSQSKESKSTLDQVRIAASAMQIIDDREFMLMLKMFNDLGLLMYYDEKNLRDLVVFKPQWLLNRMRDLFCLRGMKQLDEMIDEAETKEEAKALNAVKSTVKKVKGKAKKAIRTMRKQGRLKHTYFHYVHSKFKTRI